MTVAGRSRSTPEGLPRVVALVGPTAGGKTDLALALAPRLDAEIVSVDSRQVYRRLDVGTAKPDRAARAAVPHHLLDVVEPDQDFDAAAYAAIARRAVDDVLARGRGVLLCGGSGLYLRALTEGLCPTPPVDASLRAELRAAVERDGAPALHAWLQESDPEAARRIAPADAVRICRALEVVRATGKPLSTWQAEHAFADCPFAVLTLVLCPPPAGLEARIARRTEEMWRRGLVAETESLLAAGFSPRLKPLQSIGYREVLRHLAGEIDRDAAIEEMRLATRRYAKRQRTWFRALPDAVWLEGGEPWQEVALLAERFLGGEADAAHLP